MEELETPETIAKEILNSLLDDTSKLNIDSGDLNPTINEDGSATICLDKLVSEKTYGNHRMQYIPKYQMLYTITITAEKILFEK